MNISNIVLQINNEVKCIQCNGDLEMASVHKHYIPKCVICKAGASVQCSKCNMKFCNDCSAVILLFATILPANAIFMNNRKSEFDNTKMTALKIESLQQKGLLF